MISLEHGLLLRRHHSDRFLAKNIFTLLGMDDQQKGSDLLQKRKTRLHFSPSPFWKLFNAVRIFHFQDGGDVTNPAGLSPSTLPRKCKSGPMPPSRAKNGRQKSANPALFSRMSPGSRRTSFWNRTCALLATTFSSSNFKNRERESGKAVEEVARESWQRFNDEDYRQFCG